MPEEKESILQRIHRQPFHWYNIFVFPIITAALLTIFVSGILQLMLIALFNPLINGTDGQFWNIFTQYFAFICIWAVYLLHCFIFKKNRPVIKVLTPFCKGNNLKMFGLGLLIGGGMNLFCGLVAWLHGDIHLAFDSFPIVKLLMLFVAVLIQSGGEELVCRGYLYQKLRRGYRNPLVAFLLNASFFMALHMGNSGVNIFGLLSIFASAMLFTEMVYYFDSFWCASAAHMAWNYMQNIVLGLPNSGVVSVVSIFKLTAGNGRSSFAYDPNFGIEGTILSVIVQILVCIGIYYWGSRNNKKPTDVWEEQIKEELSAAE